MWLYIHAVKSNVFILPSHTCSTSRLFNRVVSRCNKTSVKVMQALTSRDSHYFFSLLQLYCPTGSSSLVEPKLRCSRPARGTSPHVSPHPYRRDLGTRGTAFWGRQGYVCTNSAFGGWPDTSLMHFTEESRTDQHMCNLGRHEF